MNQQSRPAFSRRNITFLAICLGGLVLLFSISAFPLGGRHRSLDREMAALKQEMTSQGQRQAGIDLVDGLLAQLDQQPSPPVVDLVPLPQGQTGQIVDDIGRIARESSLVVSAIDPLLNDQHSWQTVTIRVDLRGLFPDLRSFLLKLLTLPYVKHLDRVEIRPDEKGLVFSLTYTIDLA